LQALAFAYLTQHLPPNSPSLLPFKLHHDVTSDNDFQRQPFHRNDKILHVIYHPAAMHSLSYLLFISGQSVEVMM
jgi:hypothetical protein